jgi:hypothetical protein
MFCSLSVSGLMHNQGDEMKTVWGMIFLTVLLGQPAYAKRHNGHPHKTQLAGDLKPGDDSPIPNGPTEEDLKRRKEAGEFGNGQPIPNYIEPIKSNTRE